MQASANRGLPTERERFNIRAIWLAVERMPVKNETICRRADVASAAVPLSLMVLST